MSQVRDFNHFLINNAVAAMGRDGDNVFVLGLRPVGRHCVMADFAASSSFAHCRAPAAERGRDRPGGKGWKSTHVQVIHLGY